MPPFKDEHILIIAPGSQVTLAQLGLPESFTPAAHRFPTRMFLAPDGKTWEPSRVKGRRKGGLLGKGGDGMRNGKGSGKENGKADGDGDVGMGGTAEGEGEGEVKGVEKKDGEGEEPKKGQDEVEQEEEEFFEDPADDEGAVWPLKEGRIENMPALFALLHHVHNTLSPTLHTPVMLIAQAAWTAKDHEDLTQFVFEQFKTPALCIMDSALATSYAYGIPSATVVDVGFEKVDVTAITDFQISARGCVRESGGEAMTRRLMELLKTKGFTRDMAEQLKRSPICEILPPGVPLPGTEAGKEEPVVSNPAAAASTGASASGPSVRVMEAPRGPGPDTEVGEEDYMNGEDKAVDDDGVLDVASIVASGKTQEFLAKKEKEKAEKAAARKGAKEAREAAEAAARPLRLPNSKRPRATFHYEEAVQDVPNAKRQKTPDAEVVPATAAATEAPAQESAPDGAPNAEQNGTAAEEAPASTTETAAVPVETDATRRDQQKAARKEEKRKLRFDDNPDRIRKDIEIGLERFQAASGGYLDAIADAIHRTILSVDEISKRQDAWDALIICGSGSKVRGFKDALIGTMNNRYLVSPSSATMFMSELPSNLATPSGTGSMTPNASFSSTPHALPSASAVNPLLLAATTASNPALNPHLSSSALSYSAGHTHSSHSQSPTSIKLATPPAYFPEWKSFDEAVFLGAQVAAKVIFVVDQGLSKGFLSRVEFNEEGPGAIHQVGLVY